MMTKTGMLIVTNPNKFLRFVPRLQKEVQKTLYIQVLPESKLKNGSNLVSGTRQFCGPNFSSTVTGLYADSVSARSLDVRILLSSLKNPDIYKIITKKPVEIIYFDQCFNKDDMVGFLDRVENRTSNCQVVSLEDVDQTLSTDAIKLDVECLDIYEHVVLGGTFDRLHNGHKTLLSEAVLRCINTITVGVTNTDMLKSKKLWELIEPCELRIDNVKDFLEDVDPGLIYNVVPISDMYGPTKDDPSFQMLIVSSETLKGSVKVNEVRTQNGLNSLAVRSVDLLSDTKQDDIEEDKISSSNDRLRLLGTRLQEPREPEGLPKWPYIIGLTGGIGSGKTSISKRLENLGAGTINCDTVAHQVYKSGQTGYNAILDVFGREILGEDSEIDRKKLGNIVFNDKNKLQQLNQILWPLIQEKVLKMAMDLHAEKEKRVVFLEAALLLDAGWQSKCHEIWSCIIPREEAIQRLMKRNNLSEEDAVKRLSAQRSNSDYVLGANVVLCTLWHPNYTQKQVERAWNQLNEFLKDR